MFSGIEGYWGTLPTREAQKHNLERELRRACRGSITAAMPYNFAPPDNFVSPCCPSTAGAELRDWSLCASLQAEPAALSTCN